MTANYLYQYMGEWGLYQRRLFALMALPLILKGFQTMLAVIAFHVPAHRCQVPGLHNDTYIMQNEHHRQLVNLTVPKDEHTEHGYAECSVFTHWNTTQGSSNENGTSSNNTVGVDEDTMSCQSWFHLVCERKSFRSHLNMAFLLGNLIGSALTGLLCDLVGRKTVFYFANILTLVIGIAGAFPPTPEVFLFYRVLIGAAGSAIYMSGFVLGQY
ncbi:organic cation transporter protein-like [Littorina saxatilis]|uniref:organic cation transporter protein-like n=1 Tax=Littorina saxatilis TaxID=31220 RepID=UPI0038B5D337